MTGLGDLFFEGRVAPERWGNDHRSTLLYLETRIVDHAGELDTRHRDGIDPHMRMGLRYPTRLENPESELRGHTDYDCIRDFIAAGLVLVEGITEQGVIESPGVVYSLTDAGWAEVGRLRRSRADQMRERKRVAS